MSAFCLPVCVDSGSEASLELWQESTLCPFCVARFFFVLFFFGGGGGGARGGTTKPPTHRSAPTLSYELRTIDQ